MKKLDNSENKFFEVLQNDNIVVTDTCIKLVQQVLQSLNLDVSNYISSDSIEITADIKEDKKFNGKLSVNDYDLVFNFYTENINNDMTIPNKTQTSKYFNTSITTIERINRKLKEQDKIVNKGNYIFLNDCKEG